MSLTKSVPAIERAFAVLEALDYSGGGLSIADLSRKLAIPRSTAHTIALTLERCGYITRDASQRNCMLSSKTYLLGRDCIRPQRLALIAETFMRRLASRTMLTAHLATLEDNQAVYIQKIQGPGLHCVDTYLGKRTNLHCTSVGKVLLAYAPSAFQARVLARGIFARHTRNTLTGSSLVRDELQRITERKYALDNEEEQLGIRCLAVPLLGPRGDLLAALGVSGNVSQLEEERLKTLIFVLRQAASTITLRLQGEAAGAA